MFSCHGSYIGDYKGFFRVMANIPYELAWNMLKFSIAVPEEPEGKYPGHEEFRNNQGLVNKTWAIVGESARYLLALYNHDGTYSLYCISKEDFVPIASKYFRKNTAWERLSYWL